MLRYLLAVVAPAVVVWAVRLYQPWLGQMRGTPLLAVVLLCSRFGGVGPAVLATLVSAGLLYLFLLPPAGDVSEGRLTSLIMFLVVGFLTAWLAQRKRVE